ncbi:CHC2 zinc finger domain-containing protein [Falsiroseomonas selenitidurans]|uniref:CHC2 zinc finger domain-containing protein n=1 Tax=Falsiroseomonas selenitidurans TaxID=2716335 RepID=UPI001F34C053|nr:CHC2 zinc finger domain-containing protein [Falsiroseomonas selenitidurans]
MTGRLPESVLAEIRARLPLEAVVGRRVQLKRRGLRYSGLCPFHGERTPSFEVRADRFTFHCYGCGAHGDVFAFVMQTEGCDFREAVARCAEEAGMKLDLAPGERREALPPPPPPPPPVDRSADIRRAAELWRAARPIRLGQPAQLYLAGRRLWPLPSGAAAVLRETDLEHRETGRAIHPVMLAKVQAADGALCAVHRTYLAPAPGGGFGKLGGVDSAKRVFGPLPRGAAIRLGPDAPAMGVAEGIETSLAGAALFGRPVWSAISAGGIEGFEPPEACTDLLVLADRDKPRRKPWRPEGQGLHSARVLQGRMVEAGLAATIRVPVPPAEDYADVLMMRGRAA